MKLIPVILLFFNFLNVFSQRKVDLAFQLLEPKNGAYVEAGVDFKFTMKIRNLSTNDIKPGDTLWIYMLIDGDTLYNTPVRTKLILDHMEYDNKTIKAGDSITFWNVMQLPKGMANKTMQFCLSVVPHNAGTVTDTALQNNGSCSQIIGKRDLASIYDTYKTTYLKLYPNPANQVVTLDCPEEIRLLQITDMRGCIMKEMTFPGRYLDCSEFENGLYVVQVQTMHSVSSTCMNIQH